MFKLAINFFFGIYYFFLNAISISFVKDPSESQLLKTNEFSETIYYDTKKPIKQFYLNSKLNSSNSTFGKTLSKLKNSSLLLK